MEKWRARLKENGVRCGDDITLDRVYIDKKSARVLARFHARALPERSLETELKRAFGEMFAPSRVDVAIACPELAQPLMENIDAYTSFLGGALAERCPAVMPVLDTLRWSVKGGALHLDASAALEEQWMRAMHVDALVADIIKRVFQMEMPVHIGCQDIDPERLLEDASRARRELEALMSREPEAPPPPPPPPPKPLFERQGSFGKTFSAIESLNDESGRVQVRGRILNVETRVLKGGATTMCTFALHDGTGTIVCKAYQKTDAAAVFGRIKPDMGYIVKGDCQPDKFLEDLSLLVYDMVETKLSERMDNAESKRVELHLHTKMSSMDGVASVESVIKRAAKWGQRALAITDHGVVQAFPDAASAAAKAGIKLIYGMEGYLIEDGAGIVKRPVGGLDGPYCVVDVETTGLNPSADALTEIAAIRLEGGKVTDTFQTMVNPGRRIPQIVVDKTGITDEMVEGAPPAEEVMAGFAAFAEGCVFVAHNAAFDMAFLSNAAQRSGIRLGESVLDTLAFARLLLPELKSHKLGKLAAHFNVEQKQYHRAMSDVRATVGVLLGLLKMAEERGAHTMEELNALSASGFHDSTHIVLLAKNREGLTNLYRLVSHSHLEYFYKKPRIPKSLLKRCREGLIVGAACESGEVFQAVLGGAGDEELRRVAALYDYLEIQPLCNNGFLVRNGRVKDEEGLRALNRRVLALGRALGKPVVATCDVHYMDPEDAMLRSILQSSMHFEDSQEQPGLFMRTTEEMLEEFAYLGEEEAFEVVVTAPCAIADMVEQFPLFPKHPEGKPTFQPVLPGADEYVRDNVFSRAFELYGDPLPPVVAARIDKELKSILGHGFATLYYSAAKLCLRSRENGYLVGSRGSIGSSFVATLLGISEVNPLQAHYLCARCKYSDFDIDQMLYETGVDLPERDCPQCGARLTTQGYDTPFEIFLGFNGDKVPDVDLNFSGEYQASVQAYAAELFEGSATVYRAGTVSTLASKTAYGFVRKYMEENGRKVTKAEIDRLTAGVEGVRRTTGQHPGGMVIVPGGYNIEDFTPVQHPANDPQKGVITTHFDFNSLHDLLVKLDILGHDDPTMLNMLERLSGVSADEISFTDPATMSLFVSNDALGVKEKDPDVPLGVLGIPEFGTRFVRGMLEDTKPTTFGELIRISGLSHGTNVWLNNAQDLVKEGVATLKQCICMRDDMLKALINYGVPEKTAFDTMESVRKGKGLKPEMEEAMIIAGVPSWFIDSCRKIEYLFPKSHAAAYVMMGFRVAWYKVHYPLVYYIAYYTIRADLFDASLLLDTPQALRDYIGTLKGQSAMTAKDEKLIVLIEIVLEMYNRGFEFLPVDIYKSEASEFLEEDGRIRPPLNSCPGLGDAAAQQIVQARGDGPFLSIADLKRRARVSSDVLKRLQSMGCLKDLPRDNQLELDLSLFAG